MSIRLTAPRQFTASAALGLTILSIVPTFARAENVSFARELTLSPDGKTLAFAWAGDVWSVATDGGLARRLTVNPADDGWPVFSPDGSEIAFASDRHGAESVFVMSRDGEEIRRVTWNDRPCVPTGWSADGQFIYFHSRQAGEPASEPRVYRVPAAGGEPIRVMECYGSFAHESPDGKNLVFSRGWSPMARTGYRGSANRDIWRRELATGKFFQLTDFDGTDAMPMWDNAGQGVYFLSDRVGFLNVWYQAIDGGAARQVTRMDGDRVREFAVSADGKTLAFTQWDRVYVQPLPDGQPRQIQLTATADSARRPADLRTFSRDADEAAPSPDGKEIALVVRGEIFIIKTEPEKPTRRVTNSAARDREVSWSPDGKAIYFVSDEHGQEDIFRATSAEQPARPLSESLRFKIERVTDDPLGEHGPKVSPDGKSLLFVRGRGDLVVRDVKSGSERKLLETWNKPNAEWSPNSKWIAYEVEDSEFNADIWIVAADGSSAAVNITRHPDNDVNPQWSADGQILAFSSKRLGQDSDLFMVFLSPRLEQKSQADIDEYFSKAAEKAKKRKPLAEAAASGVIHLGAPTSQPASKPTTHTHTKKTAAASSPASKPAKAAEKLREMLRAWLLEGDAADAKSDAKPGKPVAKSAARKPGKDDADSSDKTDEKKDDKKAAEKEETLDYDLDTAYMRIRIVSRLPENQERYALSPDGQTLAFVSSHEGTPALFSVKWNGEDRKRLHPFAPAGLEWAHDGSRLFYLNASVPGSCAASGSDAKTHAFTAKMAIIYADEARQKWDDAARTLGRDFYHPTLKGLDWPALAARYRDLALRTRTHEEFNAIFDMFQGELNASHLGISGPANGIAAETIGYLGVELDPAYAGEGVRVASVLKNAPADRAESRLYVGDILTRVNGQPVGRADALAKALVATVGDPVIVEYEPGAERLAAEEKEKSKSAGKSATQTASSEAAGESTVDESESAESTDKSAAGRSHADSQPVVSRAADPAPATSAPTSASDHAASTSAGSAAAASKPVRREVVIRPTAYAAFANLKYEEWVERNRAFVNEKSGGRVAYLHISGMGEPQFWTFERDLYAAAHGKDGLIIDVRYNGGGWTADWVLAVLSVKRHAWTMARNGEKGYPQDRLIFYSWTKPTTMMCNQYSYSNAEIISHAFKTLKRGPLVGMTTFGAVISTGSYSLIDGTTIRMPFRGWYLADTGADMELNGAVPDVLVVQSPDDEERGGFAQLEAAVKTTLGNLDKP